MVSVLVAVGDLGVVDGDTALMVLIGICEVFCGDGICDGVFSYFCWPCS